MIVSCVLLPLEVGRSFACKLTRAKDGEDAALTAASISRQWDLFTLNS